MVKIRRKNDISYHSAANITSTNQQIIIWTCTFWAKKVWQAITGSFHNNMVDQIDKMWKVCVLFWQTDRRKFDKHYIHCLQYQYDSRHDIFPNSVILHEPFTGSVPTTLYVKDTYTSAMYIRLRIKENYAIKYYFVLFVLILSTSFIYFINFHKYICTSLKSPRQSNCTRCFELCFVSGRRRRRTHFLEVFKV